MHSVVTKTDPDGVRAVGVDVSNSPDRVWLYADDYLSFIEAYPTEPTLFLNGAHGISYVRFQDPQSKRPKSLVTVITACPRGMQCHYTDGDRLNLRRSNLYFNAGCTGLRKRRKTVKGEAAAKTALTAGASL